MADDLLLRAAHGEATPRPPVWLMRQAGRYLPEYREIRQNHSFKEAIKDPEIAERVSLLPWRHFEPDGVVMYSDILTVLEPLGYNYHIQEGVGPIINNPVRTPADIRSGGLVVEDDLGYVGELLERLQNSVGDQTTLIGFTGAPYTLASYLIQGERSGARKFRAKHPTAFKELLDILADAVVDYSKYQIDNGADIIQVFDTWAGTLTKSDYLDYAHTYHQRISEELGAPSIIFIRNPGGKLDLLSQAADVVGLDWTLDIAEARDTLGETPVQGNLDPAYLFGGREFVQRETRNIIRKGGGDGHILNLGHGVQKDTPMESVKAFVETAKNYKY